MSEFDEPTMPMTLDDLFDTDNSADNNIPEEDNAHQSSESLSSDAGNAEPPTNESAPYSNVGIPDNTSKLDNDGDFSAYDDARNDNEDDPDEEDEDSKMTDAEEPQLTFASLGLPRELLNTVTHMGFVSPTPIQAQAIPPLLEGKDVVGIAQTGTGKTAAFGLPMLTLIDPQERNVQALVLAPTRELALQSAQAMEDFSKQSRNVSVIAVYGGSPYGPQLNALRKGAQIVVGTPGRVIDLIEKGALDLSAVRMLVLDEADEMLRMGFVDDVKTIASSVPDDRVTALFSATMPSAIERVAATHLTDPVRVAVSVESSTVDTIRQTYAVVPFKHKMGALARVLATRSADAVIVFVRTRVDVEEISLDLTARGFRAAGISGDVAQNERERMVDRLRHGSLDVLVATDVAARGLDVNRIGLVVNFDVPREPEAYVHRIGRTGRAGREGEALTFFTPQESYRLRRIEKLTGTQMEEVSIPRPAEVSEFRAQRELEALRTRIERDRLSLYNTLINEYCESHDLTLEQVAAALLARTVGDNGPEERVQRDRRTDGRIRREEKVDENGEFVNATFENGREGRGKRDRNRDGGGDRDKKRRGGGGSHALMPGARRYRVEVGHKDQVRPGAIVGAITGEGGIDGRDLGKIDIFPTFSLVEINGSLSPEASARIGKAKVSGRALKIREDSGPDGGGRGRGDSSRKGNRDDDRDQGRNRRRPSHDDGGSDHSRNARISEARHFGKRSGSSRSGRHPR